MRKYKVNRVWHFVYEDIDEVPGDIRQNLLEDWRDSEIGDWVKADDGCIVQILRKGKMLTRNKVRHYVGTCTGSFPVKTSVMMDTSRRENIYTFSGRDPEKIVLDRTTNSKHEVLFVQYLVSGMSLEEAYLKAFPTNNIGYAKEKAARLMKLERIHTQVKEELKPVLKKLGIDNEEILKDIRDVSQTAEKEDVRLRALFKLSDILDLEDKNQTKITQVSGALFQGFKPEQLEEAQRPELPEGDK